MEKKLSSVLKIMQFLRLHKNTTEHCERKITNKYHHATIKVLFFPFMYFSNNNKHLSSERKKKLVNDNKRLKLRKENRCYRYFLISHLSPQWRTKFQPYVKCNSIECNKLFCFKKILKVEVSECQTFCAKLQWIHIGIWKIL